MRASFDSIDIIDEGKDVFLITCIITHRNFYNNVVLAFFKINDRVKWLLVLIHVLDKLLNAPFVLEKIMFVLLTLINQFYFYAFIEES